MTVDIFSTQKKKIFIKNFFKVAEALDDLEQLSH
jgi:hypothetical protein